MKRNNPRGAQTAVADLPVDWPMTLFAVDSSITPRLLFIALWLTSSVEILNHFQSFSLIPADGDLQIFQVAAENGTGAVSQWQKDELRDASAESPVKTRSDELTTTRRRLRTSSLV